MILWASSKIPGVLTPEQSRQIVDDLVAKQQADGGWNAASLAGDWKRNDSTPFDTKSDGYATGLVVHALQQAGRSSADPVVARGLAWLVAAPGSGHRHVDRVVAEQATRSRRPTSESS